MSAEHFFKITGELIEVVRAETDLIKKAKTRQAYELGQRKESLAIAFNAMCDAWRDNPESLKALPENQVTQVVHRVKNLKNLMKENDRVISIAKRATDGILNHLVEKISHATPVAQTYGATGSYAKKEYLQVRAMSFNERL